MEWSMALLMLLGMGIFHGINPGMGWLFAVGLGLQEQRRSAVWAALLPLALGHALAVGAAILIFWLIGSMIPAGVLKWGVALVLFGFGVYRLFRSRHPRYGGMQVGARELTVWSFLMATAHGAGLMVLPFVFGVATAGHPGSGGHNTSDGKASSPARGTSVEHVVSVGHTASAGHTATAGHKAVSGVHDHGAMNHAAHAAPLADPDVPATAAAAAQAVAGAPSVAGAHAHAAHAESMMAMLPNEPVIGLLATLVHTIGYLLIMGITAVLVYEKLGLRMLRKAWINLDVIWVAALILTAVLTLLL